MTRDRDNNSKEDNILPPAADMEAVLLRQAELEEAYRELPAESPDDGLEECQRQVEKRRWVPVGKTVLPAQPFPPAGQLADLSAGHPRLVQNPSLPP